MAKPSSTLQQTEPPRAWRIAIVVAIIGGLLFLRPFLSVIAFGALLAYLFNPIYIRLLKRLKNRRGLAVGLTTVFAILIVGLPVLAIFGIAIAQAVKLINELNLSSIDVSDINASSIMSEAIATFNEVVESVVGVQEALSAEKLAGFLQNTLPDVLKAVVSGVLGIISSFPALITQGILLIFVFTGLLMHQQRVLETLHYLSPFEAKVNYLYFKRIGAMASAMVKGQMLIAFLQGLVSATGLLVLGLGEFWVFFVLIFTFMSLIPLGAGIITIPIGILAIIFGDVWQGLVILLNHFVIVTNIDNFRPKLVPKEARLAGALTMLAAFAGVVYFGLLGVIYGPIIMIIITTTIETYADLRKAQLSKS